MTWRWLPVPTPMDEQALRAVAAPLLDAQHAGTRLVFAAVRLAENATVGWTTLHDFSPVYLSAEIGWTWYASSAWRTAVNTECKLLLMSHAFEQLGLERLQWKTDALNMRSRIAIERLGAQFEGIARHHRQRLDGSWRESAYYAMLSEEWPAAKTRLRDRLTAHSSTAEATSTTAGFPSASA